VLRQDALTMKPELDLPSTFVSAISTLHGDAGRRWLAKLPDLVGRCIRRWRLTIGPPYPSTYSYAAPGRREDGEPVVLKLRPLRDESLAQETRVLEHIAGEGAVLLLDVDRKAGAILLERAVPGLSLGNRCPEDDDEATAHAAGVMRRLWRPAPLSLRLPDLSNHATTFAKHREARLEDGPLSPALVDTAERHLDRLITSSEERTLLHGDLHHDNILAAARRPWLAIDPHGFSGERAYDCAALLHNPHAFLRRSSDLEALTLRRIEVLSAELGLDPDRVLGWAFVKAVLSELWSLEDHGAVNGVPLRVAQALAAHVS
jgi:streptomycin 6-kinase